MTSSKMRAVVWEGKPFNIAVKDVPKARVESPDDAVVRVTTAAICGSDLHTFHGLLGSTTPPWAMGHEAIGIVVEVGKRVKTVKVGDRVIVPDSPDDGHLTLTPSSVQGVSTFGFGAEFGNLGGCQAEFVRCPFADQFLEPVPKTHAGTNELDLLLVSDIFPTAWTCLDFSGFQPGDTVAVFGAGPVGLLCAYSAILRGASRVYSIDHVAKRLEKAASIGAIPINFTHSDPVDQILKSEPGGVNRSCDCCGFQCVNDDLKPQDDTIIRNAVRVTASFGGIGVVGSYFAMEKSAGAPLASLRTAKIDFPISDWWAKNLTITGGTVNSKILAPILLRLILAGRAKPSFIVSSEIGLEEAQEGYKNFSEHKETKVVIRFPWNDREMGQDGENGTSESSEDGKSYKRNGNGNKKRKRRHHA